MSDDWGEANLMRFKDQYQWPGIGSPGELGCLFKV